MSAVEAFRENLRNIMDARGWNIGELAEKLETSRPRMSRILGGKDGVSLRRADTIAKKLGLDLGDMITAPKKSRQSA